MTKEEAQMEAVRILMKFPQLPNEGWVDELEFAITDSLLEASQPSEKDEE